MLKAWHLPTLADAFVLPMFEPRNAVCPVLTGFEHAKLSQKPSKKPISATQHPLTVRVFALLNGEKIANDTKGTLLPSPTVS